MNASSSIALALALTVLTACGPRITDANLAEVKPDMTTKEVESILGPPTRSDSPPELKLPTYKTLQVTRYYYEQNGEKVVLTFVGDRLASGGIDGTFATPVMATNPSGK